VEETLKTFLGLVFRLIKMETQTTTDVIIAEETTNHDDVIRDGDIVVIQRHNYLRTHKLNAAKECQVQLGRDCIDLSQILGQRYGSTFKMITHETKKKCWQVDLTNELIDFESLFNVTDGDDEEPNGASRDNRNLVDANSENQTMTREQIEALREEGVDGKEIMGRLIESSASFKQKTKFSQAKFLKKKAKKYFQYLVIRRPSVRLLMQINYTNDPMKMMNLRIDSLAQVLNSGNVRPGAKYMVVETGCQGLVVAACLERLGSHPGGKIVHIYQTGEPQTQSLGAMNFDQATLDNLATLNLYHLRSLEQGKNLFQMHTKAVTADTNTVNADTETVNADTNTVNADTNNVNADTNTVNADTNTVNAADTNTVNAADTNTVNVDTNTATKAVNADTKAVNADTKAVNADINTTAADNNDEKMCENVVEEEVKPKKVPMRQKQREESMKSYDMLKQCNMDGLIIACKQHPTNILLSLIKYLSPSRPFVIYSPYKEPLMDAYVAVKESGKAVMVTLTETWLRNYQVLPDRTHPEVTMSGGGGYILSGIYVDNSEPVGYTNGSAADDETSGSRRKKFRRN
jgi:tRNA (adenine-N(1)-)-methyltransferase non-catalytic subunit